MVFRDRQQHSWTMESCRTSERRGLTYNTQHGHSILEYHLSKWRAETLCRHERNADGHYRPERKYHSTDIRWRKSARDSYRSSVTPPHLYLWEFIQPLGHRCFVGCRDQPDLCLRRAKQTKPGYES